MKKKLRLLIVEDSEDDALLVLHLIRNGGYDIEFERVENAEGMRGALKQKTWDLILSDYIMPHFDGLAALSILQNSEIDIPFIIISGTIGEETAVEAMTKGADDYIMKDNLKRLLPAIERELRVAKSRANQKLSEQKKKQAEESLRESEERYRLIAENTVDTIVILDLEFNITYVSPSVQKLSGYTVEEVMSKTLTQILTLKSLQKVKNELAERLKLDAKKDLDPNRFVLMELEQIHKNSSIIQVEISVSFIRDDKLNPIRLLVVIRDITKRKQAEEKIRILSRAVEQNPIMIVITDTKGNIEYANPKFEEVTGYSMTEVIGKNPRIIKSGKMPVELYKDMWNTIKANNVWQGELINRKRNGELFWANLSVSSITDAEGNVSHFVGIQEDISERKKIEEELIFAKEKAEESDRLKSAFLANLSHEIRTPMNSILGFAELLQKPDLSGEKQHEYIKIIEKSGVRMLNIINDIVNISKIESGQVIVDIKNSNINEQIDCVYNFFKPEAEKKNIQFSFENALTSANAFIKTDHKKIDAILTNLVKNALKFTNEGAIEFGYNRKGKNLEFFVKDTGVGIPEERQEAIFERFIQSDITDKMARQGAGLGLSIAKAYVELLGGKIWVESEEGKGSIFYFTVPYNTDTEEKIVVEDGVLPDKTENKAGNLKILIVEDDETSKALISIMVEMFSKEILEARTGIEAIEICRNNPDIDLILMDIQMPDLNGFEATCQIRQFNKDVIIIAQTAFALSDDRQKAIDSGCNDYISKPILKDELLALIQKYFSK